jgi:hypothetical protein
MSKRGVFFANMASIMHANDQESLCLYPTMNHH